MIKKSHPTAEHFLAETGALQGYQRVTGPLTWWAAFSFAAILGFSRLSYGLLLPALRANLGGSYSIYGVLGTINFVGYLLGTLTMPFLLPRIRNRLAFNTLAVLAMNITLIAAASSFNTWQLGLWRLLTGFFSAIATVLVMALTLERIAPHERGKASGLIWMGGAAGILLSGLIAPLVVSAGSGLGWRLAWIIMGIAGCVASPGFYFSLRTLPPLQTLLTPPQASGELPQARPRLWTVLRQLFQPRRQLYLSLAYFGFGCGYIIYFTYFIALVEQQGVPALLAGFIWAAIGLAGVLSSWLWGSAVDRWPTGLVLAVPLALGAIGSLSVLTHSMPWEYIGAALVGLTSFIAPPLTVTALLKRVVTDEHYAATFSTLTALFAIGQLLGPLIAAFVIARNGLAVGTATSALMLGAGAAFACLYSIMQRARPT